MDDITHGVRLVRSGAPLAMYEDPYDACRSGDLPWVGLARSVDRYLRSGVDQLGSAISRC